MLRKIVLVALLVLTVVIMSGCFNLEAPIDPHEGGIWDRYFVFPLSWTLDYFAELFNPAGDPAYHRYGLAIIVVTIILRFLILPLMVKQLRNSRAMQALQPEMQKIRDKHKENPQKMQEETMKMFQKHNVNPLAGCFPLLVQMPILIAFYHAIMRNEFIPDHSFLWLPDLGEPDPFFLMPIIAALTTFLQQKMMGVSNNPQMKILMVVLPIMIGIFAIILPSALSLYWIIGNLFTIVQTYFMRGQYPANQEVASKK